MMTDPKHDANAMADALLSEVADVRPQPDDALMARVLADAARIRVEPRPAPRPGLLAQLRELVGGWPGISGVALAGLAGIWVGTAPPAGVEDLAASLFGTTDSISLTGEGDWLFEEGALDG